MNAGKIRERVTIEYDASDDDSVEADWRPADHLDPAERWAGIEPMRGRELFEAQQVKAETSHKITMRYFQGLEPDMRITFEDREFEIVSLINVEERNKWWEVMAAERI